MSAVRTLLFDLDGTLMDSFEGISACVAHAIARMDRPAASQDALRSCVGPPLRESFARLLATTDADAIECAVKYYRERFSDVGWRENAVYPGVDDVLASLARSGHRMFVCTSKPLIYAERIIAHFRADAVLRSRPMAPRWMPVSTTRRCSSRPCSRSTARLDPASCAMIGDRAQGHPRRAPQRRPRPGCAVGIRIAPRTRGRRRALAACRRTGLAPAYAAAYVAAATIPCTNTCLARARASRNTSTLTILAATTCVQRPPGDRFDGNPGTCRHSAIPSPTAIA